MQHVATNLGAYWTHAVNTLYGSGRYSCYSGRFAPDRRNLRTPLAQGSDDACVTGTGAPGPPPPMARAELESAPGDAGGFTKPPRAPCSPGFTATGRAADANPADPAGKTDRFSARQVIAADPESPLRLRPSAGPATRFHRYREELNGTDQPTTPASIPHRPSPQGSSPRRRRRAARQGIWPQTKIPTKSPHHTRLTSPTARRPCVRAFPLVRSQIAGLPR